MFIKAISHLSNRRQQKHLLGRCETPVGSCWIKVNETLECWNLMELDQCELAFKTEDVTWKDKADTFVPMKY